MDRETAVEFAKRIEKVFAQLGWVIPFLRDRLEDEDLRVVAHAWGQIIAELDLGVLEVIYRAHPDLRPEGMVPVTPLGAATRPAQSSMSRSIARLRSPCAKPCCCRA